jgi:hypothetical protein
MTPNQRLAMAAGANSHQRKAPRSAVNSRPTEIARPDRTTQANPNPMRTSHWTGSVNTDVVTSGGTRIADHLLSLRSLPPTHHGRAEWPFTRWLVGRSRRRVREPRADSGDLAQPGPRSRCAPSIRTAGRWPEGPNEGKRRLTRWRYQPVWRVLEQPSADGELPQLDADCDFADEGAVVAGAQRIPADSVRRLQSLLRHRR